MAHTKLSDLVFVPETFSDFVKYQVTKRSEFFKSGAVVEDNFLIPQYGHTVSIPGFVGLDGADEVLDDSSGLTAANVSSAVQVAPILQRGKLWSASDLVRYATGTDPFEGVGNMVAEYWARRFDAVLASTMAGAAKGLDGRTGFSPTIHETGNSGTDSIAMKDVFAARALFGEYQKDSYLIVMTPATFAKFQSEDLVDAIPATQTEVVNYINGMRVIISSTLDEGNTAIVRPGAFGYANGTPVEHYLEWGRDIKDGTDNYASRQRFVIAPYGAQWSPAAPNIAPTNPHLANVVNWDPMDDNLRFGVRLIEHADESA